MYPCTNYLSWKFPNEWVGRKWPNKFHRNLRPHSYGFLFIGLCEKYRLYYLSCNNRKHETTSLGFISDNFSKYTMPCDSVFWRKGPTVDLRLWTPFQTFIKISNFKYFKIKFHSKFFFSSWEALHLTQILYQEKKYFFITIK